MISFCTDVSMSSLGFSSQSINLFEPYLSSSGVLVNIRNKHSSIAKIDCGVPQ